MANLLRSLTLAAALSAGAAGADETAISTRIAETGLAATAESLAGAQTAEDRLALGGVLFLRAQETALQMQQLARGDAALSALWLN